MQVHHIERGWFGNWLFRTFGIPPRAKCGAIIWFWTDTDYEFEYCLDCLDEHDAEGYAIPPGSEGTDDDGQLWEQYWPEEVDDPMQLAHITTANRRRVHDFLGVRPTSLCGEQLEQGPGQVGLCAECIELNDGWPEYLPG